MRFANPLKKNRQLVSTRGHVVDLPGRTADGTLTFVEIPAAITQEAIDAGLAPENEIDEPEANAAPKRPEDKTLFENELFTAFTMLVDRGEREDFSGAGLPKVDAVSKLLGWHVDLREIKDKWPVYQARLAEENAQPH